MAGEISLLAGSQALRTRLAQATSPTQAREAARTRTSEERSTVTQELNRSSKENRVENTRQLVRSNVRSEVANRKTDISFERDLDTGRMMLNIIDKRTGEVLVRIPKQYLPADPQDRENHRLDALA